MPDEELKTVLDIVRSIAQRDDEIGPDTRILDDGFIDSLNVFHIVAQIEDRLGVSVGVMDATVADFGTPNAILELVRRLRERQSA